MNKFYPILSGLFGIRIFPFSHFPLFHLVFYPSPHPFLSLQNAQILFILDSKELSNFLDAIASPSSWCCQWVSHSVSHNFRFAIFKQLLVSPVSSVSPVSPVSHVNHVSPVSLFSPVSSVSPWSQWAQLAQLAQWRWSCSSCSSGLLF